MRISRKQRVALLVFCLLAIPASSAYPAPDNTDIARLTLGRSVLPEDSWAIELLPSYTVHFLDNPAADTFQPIITVSHAFTDRLTASLGIEGLDAPRDRPRPSIISAEARYLIVDQPFMLTPFTFVGVPFPNQSFEFALGVEALKNLGSFTLQWEIEAELNQMPTTVHFQGDVALGGYYHFGTNGLIGSQLEYAGADGLLMNATIGGRVSPHIFVSIQPAFGLTREAPTFRLLLQLTLYFGSFRAVGLE